MQAQPIPGPWIKRVVSILGTADRTKIEWTTTATESWGAFGREENAYELLVKTLGADVVLGHQPVGMRDQRDGTYADTWGFFCRHPWGTPVPLYAKIGIHHSRAYINLFSLHPDDGSEKLKKAIEVYLKKNQP